MSSFWKMFGKDDKPAEEPQQADAEEETTDEHERPVSDPPAPEPKPLPQLPPQRGIPRYGIDDAIKLMRTLPVDDNVDLVVRVIKKTLESLSVRMPDILEDAAKRQEGLRTKIAEHQAAIVQLEREIDARRFDIARLEDELEETTTVRERLQLAEALPVTPNPMRVTPSAPPPPKKPDTVYSAASRAPSVPVTFRPKVTSEPKKVGEVVDSEDDDEPISSKDMIEKP